MKVRKKPVEVEARQITLDSFRDIHTWIGENGGEATFASTGMRGVPTNAHLTVHTLEGPMRADLGWWIIQGVKGEFYPCDPELFELSYDRVGDTERTDAGHGE